MKELKDIIAAYNEAERDGKHTALATVVHLEGSAYRRPGARMLVTEDGRLTGAISGGCLEGDALRKAQLVMVQKKAMVVTYDTTDEDDSKLGVGLGCNGIITILIEPILSENANNAINLLKAYLLERRAAVLVTLFSFDKKTAQPGTCLLLTEKGKKIHSLENHLLEKRISEDALKVLATHISVIKTFAEENPFTAFIEMLQPPISLVVFGAGNDSIPLIQMANILGWETTIADGRSNYATKERFPSANRVVVTKPENALSKIGFDARTVALLMTHNYNYDLAMLRQLFPLRLPYIGVLGPKKKLEKMLEELKDEGLGLTEEDLISIFGPSGLDIGAETSEEIALSIISEIKAVFSKRAGTSLRNKQESIHSGEETGAASLKPTF